MSNNLGKEFSKIVESRQKAELLTTLLKCSQSFSPDEFDEFTDKLDELVEVYQQLELSRDRLAKTRRSGNIVAGSVMGMVIGLFVSFALIAFIPSKFKTSSGVNFTFFGLSALMGGGGAAIGSKIKVR